MWVSSELNHPIRNRQVMGSTPIVGLLHEMNDLRWIGSESNNEINNAFAEVHRCSDTCEASRRGILGTDLSPSM